MAKVLFIGCREMGHTCLSRLLEAHRSDLIGAITFSDELAPRIAGFQSLDELCRQHDVPLLKVNDINAPDVLEKIRALQPELIVQVAWTQIFSVELLAIPVYGSVGFHCSLLPAYQGGSPVNWGIINGETQWGMTLFKMKAEVDQGDIIAQAPFEISTQDTCRTVYQKATKAAADMLDEHWGRIVTGQTEAMAQDMTKSSKVKRRTPDDGLIDWSKEAKPLYDWVRALTDPYPGAFTFLSGKKLFIWKARVYCDDSMRPQQPGRICGAEWGTGGSDDFAAAVAVNGGILFLTEVQRENGPRIKGAEIAKILKQGETLG